MAKAGEWTINGRCRWCRVYTAWVQNGDGTYGRPFEAELTGNGLPVYRTIQGKPRPVSSGNRHHCVASDTHAKERAAQYANGKTEAAAQFDVKVEAEAEAQVVTSGGIEASAFEKLIDQAAARIRAEIMAKLGKAEKLMVTINGVEKGESSDPRHPSLAHLITLMAMREHTYCSGPAGSGKSHGATQAAKLLGLRSVIQPCAGAPASRLLGFKSANGVETRTVFQDFWCNGGVFIADEFDRMLPSATAALNSLLANGTWVIDEVATPCHPDFIFCANGNTDLRGATEKFISAQQQDIATISRFAFVDWPYDLDHESAIVLSLNPQMLPVLTWARALRAQFDTDRVDKVIAGPREMLKIARFMLVKSATLRAAVDTYIWRGYPADDVKRYERTFPLPRMS